MPSMRQMLVLLLIYITIAFTFRSFSQPLLLILLVPFSITAVAWGHWLHDFPLNILSLLGIIALIGIMVNDGLVLISKFNGNLRNGMIFDDAIYEAGRSRFRAIFLTSITTIAGLAPCRYILPWELNLYEYVKVELSVQLNRSVKIKTRPRSHRTSQQLCNYCSK